MAIKFDANDTEDGATKIAFADLESGDMDVRTATHRTLPHPRCTLRSNRIGRDLLRNCGA